MMFTRGLIAFVLGSAVISSAIVYHGIASHHRDVSAATKQSTEQPAISKPEAGTPATATPDPGQATSASDTNALQPASGTTDANAQQNQASGDQAVNGSSEQEATSEFNQAAVAPTLTVLQRPVVVTVVRRPVVIVRRPVVVYTRVVPMRRIVTVHVHAWAIR